MPLVLFFNDLSLPPEDVRQEDLHEWLNSASLLVDGLKQICFFRSNCVLAFPCGQWHSLYANKPFSAWLRETLLPDHYRWFLSKIKPVDLQSDLLHQVYYNERKSSGLTHAHIVDSWVFSFPLSLSPWLSHSIPAIAYHQVDDDIVMTRCDIANIASCLHADLWQQMVRDWGRKVAENNLISIVEELYVEMYPIDHGYPHVHLVDPLSFKTLAKFRIDKFIRIEGKPNWDKEMSIWIERNRDELMHSWERCQRGAHPYKIRGN